MAKRLHPFRRWLLDQRLSYEQAAQLCCVRGKETSAAYLKQIAIGWTRPGYDFACFLSRDLTGEAVSVEAFMDIKPKRGAA